MFVDLDWPLNASSLLSASAELLVYVTLRVRRAVCSRGALFKQALRRGLWVDFNAVFRCFFWKRSHFQPLYRVHISAARWCQNVREIAVENFENSKNRRKSLCAPLRIDRWEIFFKIPPQSFRDWNIDVRLYNFFHTSLHSADSMCQTSYR